jgi:hypothetical protein
LHLVDPQHVDPAELVVPDADGTLLQYAEAITPPGTGALTTRDARNGVG